MPVLEVLLRGLAAGAMLATGLGMVVGGPAEPTRADCGIAVRGGPSGTKWHPRRVTPRQARECCKCRPEPVRWSVPGGRRELA